MQVKHFCQDYPVAVTPCLHRPIRTGEGDLLRRQGLLDVSVHQCHLDAFKATKKPLDRLLRLKVVQSHLWNVSDMDVLPTLSLTWNRTGQNGLFVLQNEPSDIRKCTIFFILSS